MTEGIHEKRYEDLYRSPRLMSRVNFSKVRIESMGIDQYVKTVRDLLGRYFDEVYRATIILTWLERRVSLVNEDGGTRRAGRYFNAHISRLARDLASRDAHFLRNHLFYIIRSYIKELFPAFDDGNPLDDWESYRLPFSHVHIDYMVVVFQLPHRMVLLRHAESKKMGYQEFLDFVLNEVGCLNEEEGYNRYEFRTTKDGKYPVRNHVIDTERKKVWNQKN